MSKGVIRAVKGGPGSGNWGHVGRPGLVGGSGGGAGGVGMASQPGQAEGGKNADDFLSKDTAQSWDSASYDERVDAKRNIIAGLAERSGVDEDTIDQVIEQWTYSANDEDIAALSLQEAAAEELGLKLSNWQQGNLDKVRRQGTVDKPITTRANERAIIRAMYDRTQEELANAGYKPTDTIQLYRGITYDRNPGDRMYSTLNYQGNSMESWSVSDSAAQKFATNEGYYDMYGEVVSMAVPVSSIVSTAITGFGCLTEGEFVIAGNAPGSKATVWEYIERR